jgi:predicted amidohydrolase
MALKYKCVVTVGYPEEVDISSPEYCNSAIIVDADGKIIANYRKTSIHYIGGTWALEGPDGFYNDKIPSLGNVAMGIYKWQPTDSKSEDSSTTLSTLFVS